MKSYHSHTPKRCSSRTPTPTHPRHSFTSPCGKSRLAAVLFPLWVRTVAALPVVSVICLLTSVLWQPAFAAGITSQHSLEAGVVSVTNTQKNSSWVPVALLFRFNAPASGTLTVERRTGGNTFLLTECTVATNRHAVWIPDAAIPYKQTDSLHITSTITNGTVEIIRKGE